jgi:hypothetical protein
MKNIVILYDNTLFVDESICNFANVQNFGDIVFKKKNFRQHFCSNLKNEKFVLEFFSIDKKEDYANVQNFIEKFGNDIVVLYFYSDSVVFNQEEFSILLNKFRYIENNFVLHSGNDVSGYVFNGKKQFLSNFSSILGKETQEQDISNLSETIDVSNCIKYVNVFESFLTYITQSFDTRYFNNLVSNEWTIEKFSNNKKKIYAEYKYYHLLPDDMKRWFIMPYNYTEKNGGASYLMERVHFTDVALYYVNKLLTENDMDKLLNSVFEFIKERHSKEVPQAQREETFKKLYVDKVLERVEELKKLDAFKVIENEIAFGTKFSNIDEIVECYLKTLEKVTKHIKQKNISVIGHGDLCFSNILYHKGINMLKLIDVKGATKEEELWTDFYYDLAKLSHSICGRYDFFNSNQFQICLNSNSKFELVINFDNKNYIELFKKYLNSIGVDYSFVRILEVSLFLSMLPLHIDYPQKVFGFILNAINILEEINGTK